MKFVSSRFGEISVNPEKVIYFPLGIPGFDSFKRYILLVKEKIPYFLFLHSVENKDLVFMLTDPFIFVKDYSFKLSDEDMYFLEIKDKSEVGKNVLVFSIVTIRDEIKSFSLNLKAPVLINIDKKIGKQVILYEDDYPVRYSLNFAKTKEAAKEGATQLFSKFNLAFST